MALLLLSVIHVVLLYAILRLQQYLPFNPQHIGPMSPRLAFNTAASFATNTNWQAYVPEVADFQRRADVSASSCICLSRPPPASRSRAL